MGDSIGSESVLILDKETSKHVIVSPGEYNHKEVPEFTGAGNTQDPLKFLEDFKKTAKWNNWRTDARKKEMFVLSLTGHAERWIENYRANDKEAFEALAFDNGKEDCIVGLFRKKYCTDEWVEAYLLEYENYKQAPNESPMEYLEKKRYLLWKADPSNKERTIKQQVRDIMKGLSPQARGFCDAKIKDPYHTAVKESLTSFEGVETLLRWAESCMSHEINYVIHRRENAGDNVISQVTPSPMYTIMKKGQGTMGVHDSRRTTQTDNGAVSTSIQQRIMDKLDKLDNDMAIMSDRITILEKNKSKKWGCYNCGETSHRVNRCPHDCTTCDEDVPPHKPKACPRYYKGRKETPTPDATSGVTSPNNRDF